jgi:predicted DNA binding CopG/RHH family protein
MRSTVATPRHPEVYLPTFCTDEEERTFWETHSPGDYLRSTRPAQVQIARRIRERVRERKQNLTLRMEPSRVQEIKAVAEERGVPYQTLMRMWIFERLRREKVG